MKNIQMVLAMLLIIGSTSLNAQSKKYKIEGTKCQRVEIIDAGELYSTYELNEGEIEMMKIAGLSNYLIDEIKGNHTEDSWPEKLGDLDARIADPDKVKSYVVYKVVTLEDKIILVAPLKYNNDKDSGWALSRDVFFVMSSKAIK